MPKNYHEISTIENLKHTQNHIHSEIYELTNRLDKYGSTTPFHKQLEKVKQLTYALKDELGYLEYLANHYDADITFKEERAVVITKGVVLSDE